MTLQQFLDKNRGELDKIIREALNEPNFSLDDKDREDWIKNDESLYQWAVAYGVFDEEEPDDDPEDDCRFDTTAERDEFYAELDG